MVETGVIEIGREAVFAEEACQIARLISVATVYDGRTVHATEDMQQHRLFVCRPADGIRQIGAEKAFSQHVRLRKSEDALYVVDHRPCSRSSQCQYGNIRQGLPDVCYREVCRPEVIAPLGYTVTFVYDQQTYPESMQTAEEKFRAQTFGRNV